MFLLSRFAPFFSWFGFVSFIFTIIIYIRSRFFGNDDNYVIVGKKGSREATIKYVGPERNNYSNSGNNSSSFDYQKEERKRRDEEEERRRSRESYLRDQDYRDRVREAIRERDANGDVSRKTVIP